jgi:hypothetical protein
MNFNQNFVIFGRGLGYFAYPKNLGWPIARIHNRLHDLNYNNFLRHLAKLPKQKAPRSKVPMLGSGVRTACGSLQGNLLMKTCFQSGSFGVAECDWLAGFALFRFGHARNIFLCVALLQRTSDLHRFALRR